MRHNVTLYAHLYFLQPPSPPTSYFERLQKFAFSEEDYIENVQQLAAFLVTANYVALNNQLHPL
jgi:hypothetical protein